MKNTAHDIRTHRTALAQAVIRLEEKAMQQFLDNSASIYENCRSAALLAVKKTGEIFTDCHTFPVDFAEIKYRLSDQSLIVECEVQAISKTGITMEAMHGVTTAALAIIDRLKRYQPGMVIDGVRLVKSKGGKNQYTDKLSAPVKTAILVCSDSVAAGKKEDQSGKAIQEKLVDLPVEVIDYSIIPDEINLIREKVKTYCEQQVKLILITGGTGLSDRDVTPEAIRPLLDRAIPGIAEAIRSYGQEHMPYAMFSRSMAGLIGHTLVLALPGSTRGASESMDALFPYLLHHFRVMEHPPHD